MDEEIAHTHTHTHTHTHIYIYIYIFRLWWVNCRLIYAKMKITDISFYIHLDVLTKIT